MGTSFFLSLSLKFSWFNVRQCKPALCQVNVKQVPLYTDISTFYVYSLSMFHFIAFGNIHHVELVELVVFMQCFRNKAIYFTIPLQSNRFLIFFSISQNRSAIFSSQCIQYGKRVRPHTYTQSFATVRHLMQTICMFVWRADWCSAIDQQHIQSGDEFNNGF